eukprot:scaffold14071_cov35-Tisochrysis_lutea.AAC.1
MGVPGHKLQARQRTVHKRHTCVCVRARAWVRECVRPQVEGGPVAVVLQNRWVLWGTSRKPDRGQRTRGTHV